MAGTTSTLHLPYPQLTDAADISQAVQPLAEALETYLLSVDRVLTDAARSALSSPPTGLRVYTSDTHKIWLYDGAAWQTVWQRDDDTYTPALTSNGTAPTMNSANRTGTYQHIGKRCRGDFKLKWSILGSGEGNGTGAYSISLPVATDGSYSVFDTIGMGCVQDAGTRQYLAQACWLDSTHVGLFCDSGVGQLGATNPVTPANGDFYSVHFDYRTA